MANSTAVDLPQACEVSDEEAEKFDLGPHLVKLLLHEPFFSAMLRRVSKTKSYSIPTAGVTVKDTDFFLLWNPKFVMSLESIAVRGLLKHECYHLIFKHCTERKQEPHVLWNWATDLAINSIISQNELPEMALYPGQAMDLSKITDPATKEKWQKVSDLIESLPPKKASEWYMTKLKQDKEVSETITQSGEGEPVFIDDHEGWGNLSDEEKQVAEGKIKQAVAEAVKRCDRTGKWGSVSADMRKSLRKMVNDSVDWRKVLHSFCGRSQRANKCRTHKRVNRKYPYIHPGTKRGHSASVAIYMDQSGSVSDEEVELFFGALNQLGRLTSFAIFPFDYNVDNEGRVDWRKGQSLPPIRRKSGGTSFHAVEKHVRELKGEFDGHIILTDGEASDPGPSLVRRCWVILPGCKLYFTPHQNDVVIYMEK